MRRAASLGSIFVLVACGGSTERETQPKDSGSLRIYDGLNQYDVDARHAKDRLSRSDRAVLRARFVLSLNLPARDGIPEAGVVRRCKCWQSKEKSDRFKL